MVAGIQEYGADYNYGFTLQQRGHELSGTATITRSGAGVVGNTDAFTISGFTWEGYVSLTLRSVDRRRLSFATALLKVEDRGGQLAGQWVYRSGRTDRVEPEQLVLQRRHPDPATSMRIRRMFEKCANCEVRVVVGRKDEYGTFCSRQCHDNFVHPGFCDVCVSSTTDEPSGRTFTINGIGTLLHGSGDICPICRSVIQRRFVCIGFIPVIPLSKYRVKYVAPSRFVSRKLRA
jgi:hypothetical protein